MIIKNDEHIRLEFGTGDICIAGGYSENREIGSEGVIKSGEVDLEEYPIVMTFGKKENINVNDTLRRTK